MTTSTPATDRSPMALELPPGWRVTDRPLRVAILGWARLSFQAREGSGYNLSASELAAGLALCGHQVSYLRAGLDFSLVKTPRVKLYEWWRGVACFDFLNSQNLSPASSNFANMRREMSSPEDARVVLGWLDSIGAQLVHVHSLEGYGLDLIKAIRDSGRPVVVTPHNYWYACPQVDLLHEELRVCADYAGGRKCVGCLQAPNPERARSRRGMEQALYRLLGPVYTGWLRQVYDYAKYRLKGGKKPQGVHTIVDGRAIAPAGPIDPEAAMGFDARSGPRPRAIDPAPPVLLGEAAAQIGVAPSDQNERFLRGDHHLTVLNEYGQRRIAGVAALNHASLVTPPSQFLLRVMETMGMAPARGRHVRLGQPHFDQINRKTRRSPYYSARPWDASTASRPVRFAFMGTTRNNKGLEVLVRSIPLLDQEIRRRCHFVIRASGWDGAFRKRMGVYPEVSFLGGYDVQQLIAATDEFDVGILPHIWFENSPLVLLEFLHAGKFVIASRLGGPPEWIKEPSGESLGNGLLFPGGNAAELAARITRIVRGEVVVPSAEEIHQVSPLRSYPAHVDEFESIYTALVDGRPLPPELGAELGAGGVSSSTRHMATVSG